MDRVLRLLTLGVNSAEENRPLEFDADG